MQWTERVKVNEWSSRYVYCFSPIAFSFHSTALIFQQESRFFLISFFLGWHCRTWPAPLLLIITLPYIFGQCYNKINFHRAVKSWYWMSYKEGWAYLSGVINQENFILLQSWLVYSITGIWKGDCCQERCICLES